MDISSTAIFRSLEAGVKHKEDILLLLLPVVEVAWAGQYWLMDVHLDILSMSTGWQRLWSRAVELSKGDNRIELEYCLFSGQSNCPIDHHQEFFLEVMVPELQI